MRIQGFRADVKRLSQVSAALTLALPSLTAARSRFGGERDELKLASSAAAPPRVGVFVDRPQLERSAQVLSALKSGLTQIRNDVLAVRGGTLSPADAAQRRSRIDATIAEVYQLLETTGGGRTAVPVGAFVPNAAQVSVFQIDAFAGGGSRVIAGELLSAGTRAELTLTGANGAVQQTATFALTGRLGSVELTVTQGESLAAVRDRVNASQSQTGVEALVDGNALTLRSLGTGSAELVAVNGSSNSIEVDGVNPAQVDDFDVHSIDANAGDEISGNVTATAQRAELTLLGGPGGVVKSTATFTVAGPQGDAEVNVTAGESLAAVRDRVNASSSETGVTAAIDGDNLVFRSADVGSESSMSVQAGSVASTVEVTGVNPAQVADFDVISIDASANQNIGGTVTAVAKTAQLTYSGFLGLATSSATFDLTGNLGTATISVSAGQSLTAVRNAINAQTATTGVTATVSGSTLTLNSTGVGSSAFIDVDVSSGTFNTSGGNGNGTANGINATAVINGQSLTGNANRFTVTAATGTYEIEFQPAFTGAFNTINVTSTPGDFEITGGNGDGTADGADATAVINGQSLTGTANRFEVETAVGSYSIGFVAGFTGSFDPIAIASVGGGLESLTNSGPTSAVGTDSIADINGTQVTGSGRRFTFGDANERYTLQFSEGFLGTFEPINVAAYAGGNGQAAAATPLIVSAQPFVGRATTATLPAISEATLATSRGNVSQLFSGGQLADFGDDALSVLDGALASVGKLQFALSSLALPVHESANDLAAATPDPRFQLLALAEVSYDPHRVLDLLSPR